MDLSPHGRLRRRAWPLRLMYVPLSSGEGRGMRVCLSLFLLSLFAAPLFHSPALAQEKIVIGAVEEVLLLPWGVKFPGRIDTGAATSSIDVCEIEVKDSEVRFTLAERCGGLRLIMPLLEMRHIRTPEGSKDRPVVEMEICIGPRRVRAQVTLNDRSQMEYPFLIGRNILEGNFMVDVGRSRIAPPTCPVNQAP